MYLLFPKILPEQYLNLVEAVCMAGSARPTLEWGDVPIKWEKDYPDIKRFRRSYLIYAVFNLMVEMGFAEYFQDNEYVISLTNRGGEWQELIQNGDLDTAKSMFSQYFQQVWFADFDSVEDLEAAWVNEQNEVDTDFPQILQTMFDLILFCREHLDETAVPEGDSFAETDPYSSDDGDRVDPSSSSEPDFSQTGDPRYPNDFMSSELGNLEDEDNDDFLSGWLDETRAFEPIREEDSDYPSGETTTEDIMPEHNGIVQSDDTSPIGGGAEEENPQTPQSELHPALDTWTRKEAEIVSSEVHPLPPELMPTVSEPTPSEPIETDEGETAVSDFPMENFDNFEPTRRPKSEGRSSRSDERLERLRAKTRVPTEEEEQGRTETATEPKPSPANQNDFGDLKISPPARDATNTRTTVAGSQGSHRRQTVPANHQTGEGSTNQEYTPPAQGDEPRQARRRLTVPSASSSDRQGDTRGMIRGENHKPVRRQTVDSGADSPQKPRSGNPLDRVRRGGENISPLQGSARRTTTYAGRQGTRSIHKKTTPTTQIVDHVSDEEGEVIKVKIGSVVVKVIIPIEDAEQLDLIELHEKASELAKGTWQQMYVDEDKE